MGGLFSYFGLILPKTDTSTEVLISSRVPVLDGPGLTLNVHDNANGYSHLFNKVRHSVNVHRLKNHYFGSPVLDRLYETSDYESVSPPLSETVPFNNIELQSRNFVYNYLKFEGLEYTNKMLYQQSGFTIYMGTKNE